MAASLSLVAARNVTWAPTINLFYRGASLPLANAKVAMQVRLYAGQPGAPLVTLDSIPFSDVAAPGDGFDDQRLLQLSPRIEQAVIAAMPGGLTKPEVGEADTFVHDIVLIYADGLRDTLAEGRFFLKPGVTV